MDTQNKTDETKQKPVEIHEEIKKENVEVKDASDKTEHKDAK